MTHHPSSPHTPDRLSHGLRTHARRMRGRARARCALIAGASACLVAVAVGVADAIGRFEGDARLWFFAGASVLMLPSLVYACRAVLGCRVSDASVTAALAGAMPDRASAERVAAGVALLERCDSRDPVEAACARRACEAAASDVACLGTQRLAPSLRPHAALAACALALLVSIELACPRLVVTAWARFAETWPEDAARPPWSPVRLHLEPVLPRARTGEDAAFQVRAESRAGWLGVERPTHLRVRLTPTRSRTPWRTPALALDADGVAMLTLPGVTRELELIAEADLASDRLFRRTRSAPVVFRPAPSPAWREAVVRLIPPEQTEPAARLLLDLDAEATRLHAPPGWRVELEGEYVGEPDRLEWRHNDEPPQTDAPPRPGAARVRAAAIVGESPARVAWRLLREDEAVSVVLQLKPSEDLRATGGALAWQGDPAAMMLQGTPSPDTPRAGTDALADASTPPSPSTPDPSTTPATDAETNAELSRERDPGADLAAAPPTAPSTPRAGAPGEHAPADGQETRDPLFTPEATPEPGLRTTARPPGDAILHLEALPPSAVAAIERVPPELRPLVARYFARLERLRDPPRTTPEEPAP